MAIEYVVSRSHLAILERSEIAHAYRQRDLSPTWCLLARWRRANCTVLENQGMRVTKPARERGLRFDHGYGALATRLNIYGGRVRFIPAKLSARLILRMRTRRPTRAERISLG